MTNSNELPLPPLFPLREEWRDWLISAREQIERNVCPFICCCVLPSRLEIQCTPLGDAIQIALGGSRFGMPRTIETWLNDQGKLTDYATRAIRLAWIDALLAQDRSQQAGSG